MLCGNPFASQNINSGQYVINVNGVNALRSAAKVVSMFFDGDYSHEHAKCNTMSIIAFACKLKSSIAIFIPMGYPYPTSYPVKYDVWMNDDFVEKTGEKFAVDGNAVRIFGNHSSLLNRFDGLGAATFTELLCPSF